MIKRIQPFFWLALLGHLLLVLGFSFILTFHPVDPKIYQAKSDDVAGAYVPAYISPSQPSSPAQQASAAQAKNTPTSAAGIEKPQPEKTDDTALQTSAPSKSAKRVAQMQKPRMKMDEKNFNPLLKLLHDATDAQLNYPQLAGDFRVSGTTRIGFTIHPNGQVTQVKMVQSSRFPPFDTAALDAINAISPVHGVEAYLKEPQYVEVNVIFR